MGDVFFTIIILAHFLSFFFYTLLYIYGRLKVWHVQTLNFNIIMLTCRYMSFFFRTFAED